MCADLAKLCYSTCTTADCFRQCGEMHRKCVETNCKDKQISNVRDSLCDQCPVWYQTCVSSCTTAVCFKHCAKFLETCQKTHCKLAAVEPLLTSDSGDDMCQECAPMFRECVKFCTTPGCVSQCGDTFKKCVESHCKESFPAVAIAKTDAGALLDSLCDQCPKWYQTCIGMCTTAGCFDQCARTYKTCVAAHCQTLDVDAAPRAHSCCATDPHTHVCCACILDWQCHSSKYGCTCSPQALTPLTTANLTAGQVCEHKSCRPGFQSLGCSPWFGACPDPRGCNCYQYRDCTCRRGAEFHTYRETCLGCPPAGTATADNTDSS